MQREGRRIIVALFASAGLCFAALVAALFLSRGTAVGAAPEHVAPRKPGLSPSAKPNTKARAKPTTSARAKPSASAPAESSPPTVIVRASAYGRILFDGRGRALYAFTRDPQGRSVCEDDCAAAWPPYVLEGPLTPPRGTRRSLLGTTRRSDSALQVTYGGRPLYYYVGDREPGQVLCQNVVEFGGTWLVLRASGQLVR